jgi:hypothetical protein
MAAIIMPSRIVVPRSLPKAAFAFDGPFDIWADNVEFDVALRVEH